MAKRKVPNRALLKRRKNANAVRATAMAAIGVTALTVAIGAQPAPTAMLLRQPALKARASP